MSSGLPPVGCVVMASGRSLRFQRPGMPWEDKLLAAFPGGTMLGRVLDLTDALPLAARTVVTRSEAAADCCRARGADAVLHRLPFRSDTVRLGLERVEELADGSLAGCLFCPADQPLLRPESVAALLAAFTDAPERIHRLGWHGRPGSPVLFPRRLFDDLRRLPAGAGGSFLIGRDPQGAALTPVQEEAELLDADTREDLARLAALAEKR